MLESQSRSQKT